MEGLTVLLRWERKKRKISKLKGHLLSRLKMKFFLPLHNNFPGAKSYSPSLNVFSFSNWITIHNTFTTASNAFLCTNSVSSSIRRFINTSLKMENSTTFTMSRNLFSRKRKLSHKHKVRINLIQKKEISLRIIMSKLRLMRIQYTFSNQGYSSRLSTKRSSNSKPITKT